MIGKKDVPEKASYDKPTTVIGEDTVLETAKLVSKSSVQISGQFNGAIEVSASLVVGETGKMNGNIKSNFVLVAGEIVGNMDVSQQVHLTKTARITGDIECASIVIDEGAYLDGSCKMKSQSQAQAQVKTKPSGVVANKKG
jgi:cytoskeletal protein CcmA (bactofilin family)